MKLSFWAKALPAAAALAMTAAPAVAQRPPSAEQQIAILRQQLAASQASASSLSQRLDAVERQLQQLINAEEQNGHRVGEVESGLSQLQTSQGARMDAIEQKVAGLTAAPPAVEESETAPEPVAKPQQPPKSKPQTAATPPAKPVQSAQDDSLRQTVPVSDPGEDAYSQGFHQWQNGDYQGAIKSLRSFVTAYPDHPRISYARNLIGRALLDEGQPRAAATELLANYRANPGGARAQDSLYYLGQALMKINQPGQACKAYAELDSVYGAKVRPELKSLVAKGEADAGCQ
jgi:TolA-binding protein